jgi:hypothetical protein
MADQNIGGNPTMKDLIRCFNDRQIMLEFGTNSFIISKEEVVLNYERVFNILKENEGICVITDAFQVDETQLALYAQTQMNNPGEGIVYYIIVQSNII